jgi:hypothetical protein
VLDSGPVTAKTADVKGRARHANGARELVVIEARDFAAPPVARVLIPARVPYGLHGARVPGEMLADIRRV